MQNRKSLAKMLEKSGLSDHEAEVYLAMLELGPTTILRIARQSGVKRTTVYAVIEQLRSRGLIGIEERGFKKLYVAENPERLERMLDEQKSALASFFPELQALYSLRGGDSIIRYYTGVEAMRSVYDELLRELRSGDDYYVLGDASRWDHFDKQYFKSFIERRVKIRLNAKVALIANETGVKYKQSEKNFNEEVRLLPKGALFDVNMAITPRRIITHPLTHPITTIVIDTPSLISMHQALFRIIWETL